MLGHRPRTAAGDGRGRRCTSSAVGLGRLTHHHVAYDHLLSVEVEPNWLIGAAAVLLEGLLGAGLAAAVERAHAIEAAIRTWSHSDARVAAAQRRLDDLRVAFVADTLAELGVPAERARVLAEMGLAMLTGFQTRTATVDRAVAREAAREWRHVLRLAVEEASASTGRAARGPAA